MRESVDRVSREFAESGVRTADGGRLRLAELWAGCPAVLVFVRQFGCIVCRREAAEWRSRAEKVRETGARLVIIGSGDPASAEAFREDLDLKGIEVLSDEELRSFRSAGFRRGLWTLLSPRAVGNYALAFLSGHRGGKKRGDAMQQGGTLVVGPDGAVLFRYVNQRSGDHADPETVLAALRPAPVHRSDFSPFSRNAPESSGR